VKHVDSNGVKRKSLFVILAILLSSMAVRADDAADLEKVIAMLNGDAEKEGGKTAVLQKISRETKVPVATLEAQKARTHLSYGEIFAANSIASGARKSFDQIAALKAQGQSWRQIVRDNRVSMVRGSAQPASSGKASKPRGSKDKGKRD
jgi:MinD-like ATPase involved in chromosome partitioning or flagellar assembly